MTDADTIINSYLIRPKKIMTYFGVWPMEEDLPWYKKILHWLYTITILFTQYSFILFEFMYMANVLGDIDELSESSFLLFTQASLCNKTTVFMVKKNNLLVLLKLMKQQLFRPQNKLHKRRLQEQARKIRRLSLIFLINVLTTTSLWGLIPLFDNNGPRIFPFKIWMPLGPEISPLYELGYLYQMISIYISACLFSAVDNVFCALIIYGCAQLEIIGDKLEGLQKVPMSVKLKPEEKTKRMKENNQLLIECIKHHQAVIKFVEITENTYHTNVFVQLCGTVAVICIIGLRVFAVEPGSVQFISMLNYFLAMLSQLLLFCWCGQELTIRSERLRELLYDSCWYEQDVKFRRSLWIIMERMNKPIILKVGHYIPLSRSTFVQILRSSYSYFAVLNRAKS